jgi:hypothetical protein
VPTDRDKEIDMLIVVANHIKKLEMTPTFVWDSSSDDKKMTKMSEQTVKQIRTFCLFISY